MREWRFGNYSVPMQYQYINLGDRVTTALTPKRDSTAKIKQATSRRVEEGHHKSSDDGRPNKSSSIPKGNPFSMVERHSILPLVHNVRLIRSSQNYNSPRSTTYTSVPLISKKDQTIFLCTDWPALSKRDLCKAALLVVALPPSPTSIACGAAFS
jgi:hypothetical protein